MKSTGRRKFGPLLLAAVAAVAVWWFFLRAGSPTSWPVVNDPPRGTAIIAFGDSLTDGTGAGRDVSYPARLSALIGRPIVNAGVPGETTADGLRRLERDVLSQDARIVLLCMGGNDMLRRQSVDEQFANLRLLIDEIQDAGALVVLLGLDGHFLMMPGDYGERYEALARETGCVYVPDILDGIVGSAGLTLADKIHPNAEGYAKIAEKVDREAGEWLRR